MELGLTIHSIVDLCLYEGLPFALLALSCVLTIRYIHFPDLTLSGSFVLGGAVAALCIVRAGLNPWLATGLAVAAGGLAGLLTAFLYVKLGIEKLLAGILSAFALYSLNLLLLRPMLAYGANATVLAQLEIWDRALSTAHLVRHDYAILAFGCAVLFVGLMLRFFLQSETGLMLRALEDEAAGDNLLRRAGLNPGAYQALALVVGNAIGGLGGALISFKEGAANAHRGLDAVITTLVAYYAGAQILRFLEHRRGTLALWLPIWAAIIGALTYFLLVIGSQRIGLPPELARLVLVGLVISAVARRFDPWKTKVKAPRPNGAPVGVTHSADNADEALRVEGLLYRYPGVDVPAVRDVSFSVRFGDVCVLSGGNGSGKTTCCQLIGGGLEPQAGRIIIKGRDLTRESAVRQQLVAYVDQDSSRSLSGTLTVLENLSLALAARHPLPWRPALDRERRNRVAEILREFGLPGDIATQRTDRLSGGQRQVLTLLTLLLRSQEAGIIVMDEPLNNLDSANIQHCLDIIGRLQIQGNAIVIVSHLPLRSLEVGETVQLNSQEHVGMEAVRP